MYGLINEQIVRLVVEVSEHEKTHGEFIKKAGECWIKGGSVEKQYLNQAEIELEAIQRKTELIKILRG